MEIESFVGDTSKLGVNTVTVFINKEGLIVCILEVLLLSLSLLSEEND